MPITVSEKVDSRETAKGSSEWTYDVIGTADQDAARAALHAEADGSCGDYVIDNYQVEPVAVDENNTAESHWVGTVTFVPPERKEQDPLEVGQSSFTFDTGGGSQHITHIKDAAHHAYEQGLVDNPAPDPQGGIGATADGVEGCDIQVPVYQFSETHIISDVLVTEEYIGKLFELTGRTNDAAFRGLDIGECLFGGASGSQRGDEDWEITFRFAGSPNVTDIDIGVFTDIEKGGWEYLWVRSERKVSNNMMIVQPVAVYVEQVYESGDFGELGIGE